MLPAVLPRLVLVSTLFNQEAPRAGDPAVALQACDLMVAQGKALVAAPCYEGLRQQYPGTPEAHDAERALQLLKAWPPAAAPSAGPVVPPLVEPGKESFYVLEPYSRKTKERLRLTTWEKLDFGVSAFIYGLSTGAAFGGATESENILVPMVIGSLAYTGLAVGYVNAADVDRGDLPLALAITSYVPLTAGLVSLAADASSSRTSATLITASGLVALPIAYWAGSVTDLDPGDMQLVRDAGFWGVIWGVTGAIATAPVTAESSFDRRAGVLGMVGLYGGMGLGLLAAKYTDVSLERVRVTTWGGYGGAIIGALIAAADKSSDRAVFGHVAIGSAAGVLLAFATTAAIDRPPTNATFGSSVSLLEPTLLPVVDRDGQVRAQPGLTVVRGRF